MGENRYLVYGLSDCPYCDMAKNFLNLVEQEYIYFDLSQDEEFLQEAKTFYGHGTVPIIVKNNTLTGETTFLGGFDDLAESFNNDT